MAYSISTARVPGSEELESGGPADRDRSSRGISAARGFNSRFVNSAEPTSARQTTPRIDSFQSRNDEDARTLPPQDCAFN
jgi:hypothetical protein